MASVNLAKNENNIETLRPAARGGVIIMCDHATNYVPDSYDNLGIDPAHMDDHIAWDPGAADVARAMSEMMDVPVIFGAVSRLLIDVNREPDHPTLIPVISDGVRIKGNCDLDGDACAARMDAYYHPFHKACAEIVQAHLGAGITPIVIAMHSFTPIMHGVERPWEIGFLWNNDPRLAQAMIGLLERETDLTVGDNEPYSGKDLYYTMQRHGEDLGLPSTAIEIRQDLLKTPQMIQEWAALLCDVLDELLDRDDVREIKHF